MKYAQVASTLSNNDAPFVSKTSANVKRRERNESVLLLDEFYNQI